MPALSIAIINNSEIAYHRVFGITHNEKKSPVTKETIFEGASLSKPIFAYFAMKMVEKGVLDLDTPLFEYVPHPGIDSVYREAYKKITPRMVLSHSTGFPNWSHGNPITLSHMPGEGFSYSGEAYQYLAAVIGQQNGVGFKEDLDEIFLDVVARPLGLQHTAFTWNPFFAEHKATGHTAGVPTDNGDQGSAFGAAYSLHSEAAEYATFLVALLKQQGMEKSYFNEMFREQNHFNKDNPLFQEIGQTGWGLGFAQKPSPYGMMHLHTGNNHDFQSYCMILPEKEYGIVIFTNSDTMEPFLEGLEGIIEKQF
jgi:CubicO group peptidase (beta-lactamase class C family)